MFYFVIDIFVFFAIADLRHKAQRSGGWAAALYLSDGTVDMDMDEAPWTMSERVEILKAKLKYSKCIHEQKEADYLSIIQRLKAVAASGSLPSPSLGTITRGSTHGNLNLNTTSFASGGTDSEPIEIMHTVVNVAMARERMGLGIGLNSTVESGPSQEDSSILIDHDSLLMRDVSAKIQKLEGAVQEATSVLLPLLRLIDQKIDDAQFHFKLVDSQQEAELTFDDNADEIMSDVSEEDLVDKILARSAGLVDSNGHTRGRTLMRIDDKIHQQRQEAFLERDKLLQKLEKKSKGKMKDIRNERDYVSPIATAVRRPYPNLNSSPTSAELDFKSNASKKRAMSAGPSRAMPHKTGLPLQPGPTGNKSFVDNNTHEGWRQYETQMRHERALKIKNNEVELTVPPSPVVVPLLGAELEKKEVNPSESYSEQNIDQAVEKLLTICAILKEKSNSLIERRESRRDGNIPRARSPIEREQSPERKGKGRKILPPPVSSATIKDRRLYRESVLDDYKRTINEANRLKILLNDLDATVGRVNEVKPEEGNIFGANREQIKSHYSSKLLIPVRFSSVHPPSPDTNREIIETMPLDATSTAIRPEEKLSLPQLNDSRAGR